MPPVVTLKTTVIPRSIMRATVLGDLMANFGATPDIIRTTQQGYADGLMTGVIVKGRDNSNYVREEVYLDFASIDADDKVSVDVSDGRSMIEAVSIKLARAVSYSVDMMKRRGLRIEFAYRMSPRVNADPELFQSTLSRFGLFVSGSNDYEPGTAMRQLFSVSPGFDKGISYSHASSRRVR
jgi:hypothetical protein